MGGCSECVNHLIPHANPKAGASNALRWAAMRGHAECVELLIPVSEPKAESSRALRLAASNGAAECLRLLIPVSDPAANWSAALRLAADEGHLECVRLLIPVSDLAAANYHALRVAIENGHIECANLLIEQRDLLLGPEPFHAALACGEAKAAAFMLAREPSLADLVDPAKLLEAAENGHSLLASLILSIIESREMSSGLGPASAPSSPAARL